MGWLVPILVLCMVSTCRGQGSPKVGVNSHFRPPNYYLNYVGRSVYSRVNAGRTGYFPHPVQAGLGKQPSTQPSTRTLDLLLKGAETVQAQLKAYREQLQTLTAETNRQMQALEQMTQIALPALKAKDDKQTQALNQLKEELDGVQSDVTSVLDPRVQQLRQQNDAVSADQKTAEDLMKELRSTDVRQEGQIAELANTVHRLLKPSDRAVANSGFDVADRETALVSDKLSALQTADSTSVCENGRVTLDTVDRKAEFQFQRPFAVPPQVLHNICGFSFHLGPGEKNANKPPTPPLGFKAPTQEHPEAIGVHVNALSTTTGVTFEMFDLGLDDPRNLTVDVCFEACSDL